MDDSDCNGVSLREIAVSAVLALLVVAGCALVAGLFFDIGYDGNSYHKVAIGALAHGWNPVYEGIDAYYARSGGVVSPVTHAVWVEHYPKASWLFGSSIYVLTGSIESAKSVNLISAFSLGMIGFDYLRSRLQRPGASALVAVVMSVNPITLPQFFTNYVDGLLLCILLIIIMLLVALADPSYRPDGQDGLWVLLAAAIIVCVNIKFTGMVYAAFFCAAFYFLSLYRGYRCDRRNRDGLCCGHRALRCFPTRFFRAYRSGTCFGAHAVACESVRADKNGGTLRRCFLSLSLYYLLVVALACCVVGSNSYVKNAVDHGSPFYPLISSQQVEIINGYQPDSFQGAIPYRYFLLSLFSRTESAWKEDVVLKVPFTFTASELSVPYYDVRRAGFGVFSSGIFVVSFIVICRGVVRLWKDDRDRFADYASIAAASVLLIGLTDGSWWARYTPCLWLLPVCALSFLLSKGDGQGVSRGSHVFALAFSMLMLVNVATFLPAVGESIAWTRAADIFISSINQTDGLKSVALSDPLLGGTLYNLMDAHVDYQLVDELPQGADVYRFDYVGMQACAL